MKTFAHEGGKHMSNEQQLELLSREILAPHDLTGTVKECGLFRIGYIVDLDTPIHRHMCAQVAIRKTENYIEFLNWFVELDRSQRREGVKVRIPKIYVPENEHLALIACIVERIE